MGRGSKDWARKRTGERERGRGRVRYTQQTGDPSDIMVAILSSDSTQVTNALPKSVLKF